MVRCLYPLFGFFVAAFLIAGPTAYYHYRHGQVRNLRVVKDGVLIRCGQPSAAALKQLVRDYGIKTVVTLRDADTPGEPPPDAAEEAWCKAQDLNYQRISPAKWYAEDGEPPAADGVRKFLAVLDDPANHPVLLHCYAGVHRTGAMCAVYRMEYDGWDNATAIAELREAGYDKLDDEWDLLGFLETYRPRRQKAE
jgi:tyrosine-protein phosphatase SIW14